MKDAPARTAISRALCGTSIALAGGAVFLVTINGPALIPGVLSLGVAATAGSVHETSRLAPAVFLVDAGLLAVALVLFLLGR